MSTNRLKDEFTGSGDSPGSKSSRRCSENYALCDETVKSNSNLNRSYSKATPKGSRDAVLPGKIKPEEGMQYDTSSKKRRISAMGRNVEVEFLLARKGTEEKKKYLVKWKGCSISESTWEWAVKLSCLDKIRLFEDTLEELPEIPLAKYDPAISYLIEDLENKAVNLEWLPKNISAFLLLVSKDNGPPISVTNTVDDHGPPKGFVYIPKSFRGKGVPPLDLNFTPGCGCKDSCKTNSKICSCLDQSDGKMPYNKQGILQLSLNYAIFECNANCSCPISCINRVVQRGSTVKLQIFKTTQKGWGVRTLQKIPKGHFIAEYAGEIVDSHEAERRGKVYDSHGLTYLFDLDYGCGPDKDCLYTVDAFKYGNVSHFFNHSCDPNITVYPVFSDSVDLNIHSLAFFTTRTIAKDEELCFDYAGGAKLPVGSSSSEPSSSDHFALAERNKKYVCHCGSPQCRKFVHIF